MGYNVEEYELMDGDKKLAEVVEFDNGQVIVNWCGEVTSIVIYKRLEDFIKISCLSNRSLVQINMIGKPNYKRDNLDCYIQSF